MTRLRRLPPTICVFHLGFGLVLSQPVMIVAKTRIGGLSNVKLTGALESNPLISGLTEY